MSSPIALKRRSAVKAAFVRFHQKISHSRRVAILAQNIADIISDEYRDKEKIYCLDVGCGDMKIAEGIQEINPKTVWTCIDIYELPEDLKDKEKWTKYRRFDGVNMPFEDKSMDVVLFCDVLHHAKDRALMLLKEASRVGKVVIVKDHFEYSIYSRLVLKAMDFIGNWGYGVEIPKRYFTKDSLNELCIEAGLSAKKIHTGIDIYSHIQFLRGILKPEWQFIAVIESNEERNSSL